MATNSKVFVSPGVYTSETDLSFVSQSVGVTTLGIVGETLKGPAFEPIFITNYNEFETYFGGTSPEKFVNTQIPKYESAYIAKSYLQQSNQLFVTRILGLSGYDAGPSWSITSIANVDSTTIGFKNDDGDPLVFSVDFSGCNTGLSAIQFTTAFPTEIESILNNNYTTYNGGTSTLATDILNQLLSTFNDNTLSGTSINYFGTIPSADYYTLLSTYTAATNVYQVSNVNSFNADLTDPDNDSWYYSLFENTSGDEYDGYSFYTTVTSLTQTESGCFTGTITGTLYSYSGTAYCGYNNIVLATLRSRGTSVYSSTQHGPQYEVSTLGNVLLDFSGSYADALKNPYSPFAINITNDDGDTFIFKTSLQSSDTTYINKVFGSSNFSKPKTEVPLFVEESFLNLLNYGYKKGFIRGINQQLISLPSAISNNSSSIANYLEQYQSAQSPWVVSELRGNTVYKLFRFITISDGNAANMQVKISIANMSFNSGTFDILVRDYYDTDNAPVVLEKFTNCNMDPNTNSFIAKKIGSQDGEYALNSRFVMVEMNEDAPTDALPCGFEGYVYRLYDSAISPFPVIKNKYYQPGEVLFNPPFNFSSGADNKNISSGDNVKRVYLGISNTTGYDPDFFEYIGKQNLGDTCVPNLQEWPYMSKGFHMDSGATIVTIPSKYSSSGQTAFYAGISEFRNDPSSEDNAYYRTYARKFTLLVAGGFDGWDIYSESRTNADRFRLGASGFLAGACQTDRFPTANGNGNFKVITIGDNARDWGNTDYYAYLLGQKTFSNPESVNINVFVTPGIDYVNNSNLVEAAIEMVEFDRADSLYVCTTPDYDMFVPSTTNQQNMIYPQEAVDNLEIAGIDSNYTATYYPWVLTRDTVNNTQIYIPPTAEVVRNIALTDNISFPWFASAGYTRGLVNSIKARRKITQEDRDTLYQGRINPIATFSDVGTVIFGNKTLQIKESALDRLNVRRLLLQARKLISAVAVRLLFEQNDAKVRQDFLDTVNPILAAIRRDRGLYDFRVTVSSSPEDLDRNQLVGKIYIKPTKSLEFIDIEFLITPTGASFENI